MFSKRNPMKYFSGNAFARLPLYKLVAGGSAVVLTASIGLGVMAASFTPQAQPEPTPEPTAIVEATPTPTPEPTATPEPDKDRRAAGHWCGALYAADYHPRKCLRQG